MGIREYRVMQQKKKNKRKRILILSLAILVLLLLGGGAIILQKSLAYQHVEIDKSDEQLGIEPFELPVEEPEPISEKEEEVKPGAVTRAIDDEGIEIALFGLDRRGKEAARSDSIMVARFDPDADSVKIASLLRDTLVEIDGKGKDKLNHAYSYGGPELAIRTINQNYGTRIRNYVAVDFTMLAGAIDAIGGVTIEVSEQEQQEINKNLRDLDWAQKRNTEKLNGYGDVQLTGDQAVAYSRIRAIGGDFERSERQRIVLQAMLNEVKAAGVLKLASLWMEVAPHVETSLDEEEILSHGKAYVSGTYGFEQSRFPEDDTWKAGRTQAGGWVMVTDLDRQKKRLRTFLNGEEDGNAVNSTLEEKVETEEEGEVLADEPPLRNGKSEAPWVSM